MVEAGKAIGIILVFTALGFSFCVAEPALKAQAEAWCAPRGYETFRDRSGYRCRDPKTGAVFEPPKG